MCRERNLLFFCAIPVAFYISARIYFGAAYLVLGKILPSTIKNYGIIISQKFVSLDTHVMFFVEWTFTLLLLAGALFGLYNHPTVNSNLSSIYKSNFGDIVDVVYDLSVPEVKKVRDW